ncbi:MAG: hypothetical protein K9N49_04695, partial [Candidatus Marinimicrobia bacterium]|nr:hypothetical protein [Candidatus Neomarinimicrobiota bacterium]
MRKESHTKTRHTLDGIRHVMRCALMVTLAQLLTRPTLAEMHTRPGPAPEWRGTVGTDYLGPDVLWRPREWLVFHMLDDAGTGFDLEFTVRDMNIYMQGPRRVLFWVIGPEGETLHQSFMEDDGVVAGNEQYRDGIYDVYQDYRYREWHRIHSPGGYPPGKQRSPYLAHPERLPYRRTTATVPAGGPGL